MVDCSGVPMKYIWMPVPRKKSLDTLLLIKRRSYMHMTQTMHVPTMHSQCADQTALGVPIVTDDVLHRP